MYLSGSAASDYSQLRFHYGTEVDAYTGTGNAHSIAANRLSYILDLRGPSLAVDTACSSSLVAVHLASQSLQNWRMRSSHRGWSKFDVISRIDSNLLLWQE